MATLCQSPRHAYPLFRSLRNVNSAWESGIRMPEFTYIAKDRTGRIVEGTIYADNSALAAGKVREMGYFPEKVRALQVVRRRVNLAQKFAEAFIYPVVSGVKLKELALFYRQFATMIDAGIPLYQSLVTLENQTKSPKLAEIIRESQEQVQRGGRLSEVFQSYPWVFNELQIEMIRAAEHGGMLDRMLLRIAEYLEKEIALRQLISRLTIYPKIVVIAAWFILGIRFFVDAMPAFSKLIVGAMGKLKYEGIDYLNDTLVPFVILGLIIFGIVAFCRISLFQSGSIRESYEQFKFRLPGLGSVARKFALAKFGRAFGAMYEAGLPLNTAIRVGGKRRVGQSTASSAALSSPRHFEKPASFRASSWTCSIPASRPETSTK
jgi:type IV pilus assembly protein PilC